MTKLVVPFLKLGIAAFDRAGFSRDEFIFACGNHNPAHTASLSRSGSTMQLMQEMTEEHGCSLWGAAKSSDQMIEKPVHKHLIVRAEVERPLTDPGVAADWMRRLIERIGMNITEHGGPHCDYTSSCASGGAAWSQMCRATWLVSMTAVRAMPQLPSFSTYSCSDYEVEDVFEFVREICPTGCWTGEPT